MSPEGREYLEIYGSENWSSRQNMERVAWRDMVADL
jgi:hypothetical protein